MAVEVREILIVVLLGVFVWSCQDELKNDAVLKNKFTAHAVQIIQETQFAGTAGKSYFVTAVNEDNVESARSAVVAIE